MEEARKDKPTRPKARQSLAHISSKFNSTTDIAALKRAEEAKSKPKRSRGKSIGPGGLEALTEIDANALKVLPAFQPKSILKPTIPLTPPKAIPSFGELHKKPIERATSPLKNAPDDMLIDFSTPAPGRVTGANTAMTGFESLIDPFSPMARETSNPIVPQETLDQSVVDEKEQRRQEQKKAAMEQRAARRKSLANRRVSFAPEATLHTWSVMELLEDSTTSSASGSTRRQSAMTAAQSPAPPADTPGKENERPLTPSEQQNEELLKGTSESQRDLHQRKRRRTSDSMNSSDDEAFSSPGDEGDSSPIRVEESIDSESDTDGDTAMSLDEATQNTIRSLDSSNTQTSLDKRLRAAASQASTKGSSYDKDDSDVEDMDDDNQPMDIADETVTHAFRNYARKENANAHSHLGNEDKENIDYFGPDCTGINQNNNDEGDGDITMGITMEMTRAVGGILPNDAAGSRNGASNRRQTHAAKYISSADDTSYGDETMDLTVAKGGILCDSGKYRDEDDNESTSDGEMTMEMTNVVGGLRSADPGNSIHSFAVEETESMDMTMAAGGILPPIEEQTEPQSMIEDGMTGAMDMTRAVGKILGSHGFADADEDVFGVETLKKMTPSAQLKQELDDDMNSPSSVALSMAPAALETGSPTLKPRLSARRAAPSSCSTTPKSVTKIMSPEAAVQTTPSKQLTPAPARGTSPRRTPILAANVTTRGASPKKLFAKELQQRASPASRKSPRKQQHPLFAKDENTGLHTPRVVLHAPKPHQHLRRQSSGMGIENEGTGSPRVSEILSRRTSIGDAVPDFQLQPALSRRTRFEDPKQMEHELDAERAEEHRRESGRFIMEQEASQQLDENTTQNLKDMIESMTPKKEKPVKNMKGRKSLAVGSARGLLGKRPTELDADEDEEDGTPKRLKTVSREGSPVKKVHLPKPPSKEETTGRLSKIEQLGLGSMDQSASTPTLVQSPVKKAKSPQRSGKFKSPVVAEKPTSFEERLDNVVGATEISTTHPEMIRETAEEEKLSLQQFLNMTNIHFIELSTTKRRHTMVPPTSTTSLGEADGTSQATFVAAATTLPLLELYQHATRELKSYISSGRKIVRQIETETLADQPAIFKEYVDARPEVKATMDNQFRNGKTNARLQSKEGWYTWRGQLVDGLQTGLEGIRTDLEKDKQVLLEQQQSLDQFLPALTDKKEQLEKHSHDLRRRLDEFESFDHEMLKARKQELASIDAEVAERSERLSDLIRKTQEKDDILSQAAELRQEMNDQIDEATRVQEEQRRWPVHDVAAHKKAVDNMEAESGWKLLNAEDVDEPNDFGVALTLQHKAQLRLFFYPAAFQSPKDGGRRRSGRKSRSVSGPSAPISLTYGASEDDESDPKELSTKLRFFLQLIQSQLHGFTMMPKGTITCQKLLQTVSEGWSLAEKVAEEIHQLESAGMVKVSIMSDEKLSVKLVLMQANRSRTDVEFMLTVRPLDNGEISTTTTLVATPVYGPTATVMDASRLRKVQHALTKEVESKTIGEGSWINAIRGFEEWLTVQVQVKQQETLKPKLTAKPQPQPQPQAQLSEQPAPVGKTEPRRATTQSPKTSTTPKAPARSPLAPKTTNTRIQKKALPVPKKPVQLTSLQQENLVPTLQAGQQKDKDREKENIMPVVAKTNGVDVQVVNENMNYDDVFEVKAAIPPEMQEAMMHTPMKRRAGALRRSPV